MNLVGKVYMHDQAKRVHACKQEHKERRGDSFPLCFNALLYLWLVGSFSRPFQHTCSHSLLYFAFICCSVTQVQSHPLYILTAILAAILLLWY
jgi:hypothetical protein